MLADAGQISSYFLSICWSLLQGSVKGASRYQAFPDEAINAGLNQEMFWDNLLMSLHYGQIDLDWSTTEWHYKDIFITSVFAGLNTLPADSANTASESKLEVISVDFYGFINQVLPRNCAKLQ